MFHAINARKARLDRIIDGVGKQPREDLITSSLFGTLQFLDAPSRSRAIAALIGEELPGTLDIDLWPYFARMRENSEPDVVLRCTEGDITSYWIVEVKWGASLGAEQIGREIQTVRHGVCRRGTLPPADRNVIGYTLLGAEPKHAQSLDDARLIYPNFVHSVAWPDVTNRLRALARSATDTPGLTAWVRTAEVFLSGTARGVIFGEWPDVQVVEAASFEFRSSQNFRIADRMRSVPAAHFVFEGEKA